VTLSVIFCSLCGLKPPANSLFCQFPRPGPQRELRSVATVCSPTPKSANTTRAGTPKTCAACSGDSNGRCADALRRTRVARRRLKHCRHRDRAARSQRSRPASVGACRHRRCGLAGPDWLHEIKHDGFRIMARRDATGVRLITRNGHAPLFPCDASHRQSRAGNLRIGCSLHVPWHGQRNRYRCQLTCE
jgi:hypothetical protein